MGSVPHHYRLIVKDVLDPQDAATAVNHGAYGTDTYRITAAATLMAIVSPIEVPPEIVDAVGKRTTVFMIRH